MALKRIRENKKLRLLAIILSIFLLIIIAMVVFTFAPLLIKLFNYVAQNGINGVIESAIGFLGKLWTGTGNYLYYIHLQILQYPILLKPG